MTVTRFEVVLGLATLVGLGGLSYHHMGPVLGDEQPKQGLTGSVRVGGRPLARGTVWFNSSDEQKPWSSGGAVVDGRYEVPEELGLRPGRFRVEIAGVRDDDVRRAAGDRDRREPVELPAAAAERFDLGGEVELDLTSGTVVEADFDLR